MSGGVGCGEAGLRLEGRRGDVWYGKVWRGETGFFKDITQEKEKKRKAHKNLTNRR